MDALDGGERVGYKIVCTLRESADFQGKDIKKQQTNQIFVTKLLKQSRESSDNLLKNKVFPCLIMFREKKELSIVHKISPLCRCKWK